MSLARLKVHHRSTAQVLVFLFLALISFRLLYGVPPVSADIKDALQTTSEHSSTAVLSKINSQSASIDLNHSNRTSESSGSKPLAPFKTFKNKIIKEKSFNPAEILDLRTIKFNPETPQLISPSQGKRFLTTHSNAPPSQK